MEGILKKVNHEYIIFHGNNYSITDKLDAVVNYKTHIYIEDNERRVLLNCKGYVRKKTRGDMITYFIGKINLNDIINKQLNSFVNIKIKNIQEYSEEGAAI